MKPGRAGGLPSGHLVGQPNAPGLIASPWVVRDPIGSEPFAARRARLAKAGQALVSGLWRGVPGPGSAGPCENGQVEGVLPARRAGRREAALQALSRQAGAHPLEPRAAAHAEPCAAAQRGSRLERAARRGRVGGAPRRPRPGIRGDEPEPRARAGRARVGVKGGGDQQWPAVAISRRGARDGRVERFVLGHAARRLLARRLQAEAGGRARRPPVPRSGSLRSRRAAARRCTSRGSTSASARPTTTFRRRTSTTRTRSEGPASGSTRALRPTSLPASTTRGRPRIASSGEARAGHLDRLQGLRVGRVLARCRATAARASPLRSG